VVGIGASAGGIQALLRLFEQMPADSGMAFVVVLHLSPKYESRADEVLQRVTSMPVVQVREPTHIEKNSVYLISPSNDLSMFDGYLRVTPAERPSGRPVAIDRFFRSLANAHGARAVSVILSGTGSDGTAGIGRIKECGGVTLAQSADDAEYGEMPQNAIATGLIDMSLPVVDLPQKLIELWSNAQMIQLPAVEGEPPIAAAPPGENAVATSENALQEILKALRIHTGHDFRHYKRATVLRRIERRLQVNALPDLPSYLLFLERQPDEHSALLRDMLIGVTNFFRDREAFEALEREVVPRIFEAKNDDEQVRACQGDAADDQVMPVSNLADVEIEWVRTRVGSHAVSVVTADSRSPPGRRGRTSGSGPARSPWFQGRRRRRRAGAIWTTYQEDG